MRFWTGLTPRRQAAAGLAACLVLVLLSVLLLDRPIATAMHTYAQRPAWAVFLTYIGDMPQPAAVGALAAAGAAWLCGWRPGHAGRVVLTLCVAILLAVSTKEVLKFAFGRLWPETWVDRNPSFIGTGAYGFFPFHGGRGWASFPSGHTTAITAPCAVLWRHARSLRAVWVLLPMLVVAGLLGSNYHFLADCIAGAFLGAACAWFADNAMNTPAKIMPARHGIARQ